MVCTGYHYLKSESFSQVVEPFFHLTQTSQPFAERLYCCFPLELTNFCSDLVISLSFFLWSTIASNSRIWSPFSSHMAYIDSEIVFLVSTVTSPSSDFTSYYQVSMIGLALDLPMTFTSWSHLRSVTRPLARVPPQGNINYMFK